MGRRKGISDEQCRRRALSAVRREDSIVSLSRETGVSEQTLHRWRDLFIKGGCERLSSNTSPEREEVKRLKKELTERDQVVGVLRCLGIVSSSWYRPPSNGKRGSKQYPVAPQKAREARHGGFSGLMPTLVTDNGGCFMSRKFHDYASQHFNHVRIQYRTPTQLGLLERFHGTLKDEEVYWNLYDSPADARCSPAAYQERYNRIRPHWALQPIGGDPLVPADVYLDGLAVAIRMWQGWVQATRKKLLEMTEDRPLSGRNNNQNIFPELSMEIQIENG